jgi:UDP-N-acetyl-D-mannosaminuronic acid dehydrogenase
MMYKDRYPIDVLIHLNIEKIAVKVDSSLFHAMTAMEMATAYGLPAGLAIVVDEELRLVGVITDGDVREALLKSFNIDSSVTEVMTKNPVVIFVKTPVEDILDEVRRQIRESGRIRTIRHAVLIDESQQVMGLIDVGKLARSQSWHWDRIGVIGLGYVGLTIAISLAEVGYEVIGWDRCEDIRTSLQKGVPHIYEIGLESLLKVQLKKGRFIVGSSCDELRKCRVFLICVNTPVANDALPDLSQLEEAVIDLIDNLKPGDLVVVRSTVPVGTCRNVVKSIIEARTKYVAGKDFGLVFVPERTVEGRALEELRTLPQIIGGINDWSTEAASRIFSKLNPIIVRMDTLEEAEFVKLVNNTFRDVSFAFANEVAMMCEDYNLNAVKIIKAANSGYPRNIISLPSPGVGGPCLKKDPYIFVSTNKKNGMLSLAEIGRRTNEQVPKNIVRRLLDALQQCGKEPSGCSIFVLGFAFKGEPETIDMRESPTLDLVAALRNKVRTIYGYDPIVPRVNIEEMGIPWKGAEEGFVDTDAVLFMNNHHSFASMDIYRLVERMNRPAIFFDGWSLFDSDEIERIAGVRYMGLGYLTPWVESR